MAIKSGFFNSVGGDRKYNAEDISQFFGGLISSGVLPNPGTNLQVVADSGMTVHVKPGKGYIDSHWVDIDADEELTLATADTVLNRIDAIIMKLDLNVDTRAITIEVKKGTPATNPTAPSMIRNTTVQEFCLATVYVGKLVTKITQANITDTRANTDVCGWVTALIDRIDTSTLFAQWQTAYAEYFADMEKWKADQQRTFESWYTALAGELNVNCYVEKYHKVVEIVDEDDGIFALDMDKYEYSENDILMVNLNGITLTEVYDYLIDTRKTPVEMHLKADIEKGNILEITALKPLVGQRVISASSSEDGPSIRGVNVSYDLDGTVTLS